MNAVDAEERLRDLTAGMADEVRRVPAAGAKRIRAAIALAAKTQARAQEIANAVVEGMGYDIDEERAEGWRIDLVDDPGGELIAIRSPIDSPLPSRGPMSAAGEYERAARRESKP